MQSNITLSSHVIFMTVTVVFCCLLIPSVSSNQDPPLIQLAKASKVSQYSS